MWDTSKPIDLPLLLNHRRYPAFEHLLALGLLHTFIDGVFVCIHVHHVGWARLMHLPVFLKGMFVFSSLLGVTIIFLAFWARVYPLFATMISSILYGVFGVLFCIMVRRFPAAPMQPRSGISPQLICGLILAVIVVKSMMAAIEQHRSNRRVDFK